MSAPATNTTAMREAASSAEHKKITSVDSLTAKLTGTACLDMVFVMDCTGSMGSYIAQAQRTIAQIVETIVSAEKADVQFALIAYRDHPPQDSSYVTQDYPFTRAVSKMRFNLCKLSASGGGDGPEAVVDGLHAALELDYRKDATKVCILIADAPPHGLDPSGDGFPDGCPCKLDPIVVCRDMAQKGITLYCIGCEPSITPYRQFFMAISHITGGQYCPLGSAEALSKVIVGGVREEMCLERLMEDVKAELESTDKKDMSEEEQASYLYQRMREKKVTTRQLQQAGGEVLNASPEAVTLSKAADLAAVRSSFKTESTPMSHYASVSSLPSRPFASPVACSSSSASAPSSDYCLAESEEISYAQCSRMVNKAKYRNTHS